MDQCALADIHAAAFGGHGVWDAGAIGSLLASPGVFAVCEGPAFALVRVVLDEAELLTLAVHPRAQRRGAARKIMLEWHQQAAQRGATCAFLEVAADNRPARALYAALEYTEVGKRKAYYPRTGAPAVDAVLLRRTLTLS